LPTILVMAREWRTFTLRSRMARFVYVGAALALVWQWIASIALSAGYFLISPAWAMHRWTWPFFATFDVPIFVFALALLIAWRARVEPTSTLV
jgi:hypothetical protein